MVLNKRYNERYKEKYLNKKSNIAKIKILKW